MNPLIKTRRFLNLTFQIIFNSYPEDNEKIRSENIDYLFKHTIYNMSFCEQTYDKYYGIYRNHERAKIHAMEILTN